MRAAIASLCLVAAVAFAETSARTGPRTAPDYLGEPPPGDSAVVFARGIVSDGRLHGRLVISPDGRDLFWTAVVTEEGDDGAPRVMGARVMHAARTDSGWTAAGPAFPAVQGMSTDPLLSPDGSRLYCRFARDPEQGWQTRCSRRTGQGWSEPEDCDSAPRPGASFTETGRAYYMDHLAGKPWNRAIYVADVAGSTLANARALPASINSPYIDYTPYIAPDESYLMFCSSRPSTEENMYLYVSFRRADDSWSTPRAMNDALGFSGNARFPSLSPDGAFLFFCGDDGNMYWVRSEVIQRLRE